MLAVKVFALLALVACVSAKTRWHQLNAYSFADYKREFSRQYVTFEEHEFRRAIFEEELAAVRAHNAAGHSWKVGINHMSDWTPEEFERLLGYDKAYGFSMHKPSPLRTKVDISGAPPSVDWRLQGVVSTVKDQGRCGSCWSFGSAETIESIWAIKTGQLHMLSQQNILDCTPNPQHCGGTGGCNGGTAELAYGQLTNVGIASEWTYPYMSWHGDNFNCHFDPAQTPVTANVTGYTKLPSNEYEPLIDALVNVGPIAISVEAILWKNYEEGIFNGCNQTNPDIDHNVQLVGYGSEEGVGYWIIRNSWTPVWGEKGYIRIMRTDNEQGRCGTDLNPQDGSGCSGGPSTVVACGTCGILFDTVYPHVA